MAMEILKEFFEEKIIEIKMSRDPFGTVGNRPSRKNDLPVPLVLHWTNVRAITSAFVVCICGICVIGRQD